jgi:putative FmdB family regulatory protein
VPTYDYQCRSCGRITEVIHGMTEAGPTACEHCGGDLRRVLYPTGIIFKGSGFYKTDSRGSSSASVPSASGDGGSATSGGGSGSSSTDGSSAKPASKEAPKKPPAPSSGTTSSSET